MFARIFKKWNDTSLILRIVIGMIVGIILALVIPPFYENEVVGGFLAGLGEIITLLGSIFVGALKAVAPVLVFFLVISALANAKTDGSMKSVLILYVISTLIAATVAVVACFVFPIELPLTGVEEVDITAPSGIGEVLTTLVLNVVTNPVESLANANYLGILAWACLLGIALRAAKDSTKEVFTAVSDAVSQVVRWVISLAPFGIMGLIYDSVATSGLDIFVNYGQLLLVLVGCMFFIALVTNPLIVYLSIRQNPYPLVLRCLRDSGLTAFFTRSSAANIPVNMELCRRLGLNKDLYSVSIPLGATINMAGAAVTISVMAMSAAHTMGVTIDPLTAILLCVLSAVSACGASGVAGGSLLLIPLACSLFGLPADVSALVVGIGFIIGVIQDSCETALNSSSDALFTATAEYKKWRKEGKEFKAGKDAVALESGVDSAAKA